MYESVWMMFCCKAAECNLILVHRLSENFDSLWAIYFSPFSHSLFIHDENFELFKDQVRFRFDEEK